MTFKGNARIGVTDGGRGAIHLTSVAGTLPTTTTSCTTKTKLKKHTKLYNKNPKQESTSASKS